MRQSYPSQQELAGGGGRGSLSLRAKPKVEGESVLPRAQNPQVTRQLLTRD